jgi:large subunit ribosomal protein L9
VKVILLDELKGRGGEGDVIEVATGYAVNFLLPRKIAIPATQGNLKQLEQRKHNIAKREARRIDTADQLMTALEGQKIKIGAKVGEEGQLFGSVTPIQVAEAINKTFGVEIDRRRIDLHGVIKTAGEHGATISVYRDTKANIIIEVVNENLLKKEIESAGAETDQSKSAETVKDATPDTIEDPQDITKDIAVIETALESVAETLVEAADNVSDDNDAVAIADAAVEVLQDVEDVIDAAVVNAGVADVEEQLAEVITDEPAVTEVEAEAEAISDELATGDDTDTEVENQDEAK